MKKQKTNLKASGKKQNEKSIKSVVKPREKLTDKQRCKLVKKWYKISVKEGISLEAAAKKVGKHSSQLRNWRREYFSLEEQEKYRKRPLKQISVKKKQSKPKSKIQDEDFIKRLKNFHQEITEFLAGK